MVFHFIDHEHAKPKHRVIYRGNDTTKRFSRTLSESFADSRAPAIEAPEPSHSMLTNIGHRAVIVAGLVGICVFIALLLAERFYR